MLYLEMKHFDLVLHFKLKLNRAKRNNIRQAKFTVFRQNASSSDYGLCGVTFL
jgi:hypothetical protein